MGRDVEVNDLGIMKDASNAVTKAILTYSVCSYQDSSGAILDSSPLLPICDQRIP